MTSVFVAPNRTKNCFGEDWDFVIVLPMIAAWPEPKPGRNEQRGEAIKAPINGLRILDFGLEIFCFGIVVLFLIVSINIDAPKRPVSKGKRG